MAGIRTTVGLISGINTGDLVDSLITLQRQSAVRMETQINTIQSKQAALQTAQASLLALSTSASQFKTLSTFKSFTVASSDESQLTVTAPTGASPGDYQFRTVQTARTHELVTTGVANADTQTFGAGKLVIASGGGLNTSTSLSSLRNGGGIRRGQFRITDRSGATATIDLSSAFSVNDVLDEINNATISVEARAEGGHLVLEDTSGSTSTSLSVVDLNGGHAAADLGLAGSVSANVLQGSDVLQIEGNLSLDRINDGNQMRLATGDDLRITLTDDTVIDVDLNGAKTIDDVLEKINSADSNGGKLLASLSNGRIVLEDQSGGGGSSAFAVTELNEANVIATLGLGTSPSGSTLTGRKLAGGINSVLLRNLNGGEGIATAGTISVTDRAGRAAELDLSSAESLDEVLAALNGARTVGDEKLSLKARVNAAGTGIEILDTSGSTASNLTIADVGGSTLATDLKIAVDAAATSVDSGNLHLRYVNEATSLSTYAPGGKAVPIGAFRITDSNGAVSIVVLGANDKTIGDVLKKINAASEVNVTARLNDTGDGIAIIDEAGGAGALKIEDASGKPATGLRLVGEGTANGEGKSEISSRRAVVIDVTAEDTLNAIVSKLNNAGGKVSASLINTGGPVNPVRLVVRSSQSGQAGSLFVEEGALNLGFSTRVQGRDAVLQVGGDASSAYYLSSSNNTFSKAIGNLDVTAKAASQNVANVTVSQDVSKVRTAVQSLVTNYNTWLSTYKTATKFDLEANQKGVLQGDSFTLRIQTRLERVLSNRYAPATSSVRTLQDLGVAVGTDGALSLDAAKLNDAVAADPKAVEDFFRTATTGFAESLEQSLTTLTDSTTGLFKAQNETLQLSVDSLTERVEAIDAALAIRRERLLLQFTKMEQTLASLQDTQTSLAKIGSLTVNSK